MEMFFTIGLEPNPSLSHIDGLVQACSNSIANALWPLLLTWFNFNPSMDK